MKYVLVVLAILGAAYYHYLGSESETPEYLLVKLAFESEGGRPLGLTAIEKLPPGISCSRGLTTKFSEKLKKSCGNCEVETRSCSGNLSSTHEKAFEDRTLSMPYFSYEKGGLLPQQDFRLLFHGLDKAEAGGACVEMRKLIKNDLLFFIGGKTECVRESVSR